MTIDIDAIRDRARLAAQAAPGEWYADHTVGVYAYGDADSSGTPAVFTDPRTDLVLLEHIAGLGPQVAVALADELDRLRAQATADAARADRLDQENTTLRGQLADKHDALHRAEQEIASHAKAVTHWAKQVEELTDELTAMREKAAKTEREQALVVEFNSRHLIGTPVRYWKGAREGNGKTSKTRTGAQMLSGHTAVVWVEGEGACIALSHIEPLATTAEVA